ncbi:hypothetical protein [Weissella paramesenteroides]|uniref:hypothetical protein n=1 Tax=Weissella paramesenteroides TaxID=1249 RepID=UPI003F527DF1
MMIRFYSAAFVEHGQLHSIHQDVNITAEEATDMLDNQTVIYSDNYGFMPVAFDLIEE